MINKPSGYFAQMALQCPLNATTAVRTAMCVFVSHNVDNLLEELTEACSDELNSREHVDGDPLEPRDVCSAAKMLHYTNAIDTVRRLSSWLMLNDRRTESSVSMLRACRHTQYQQFAQNFDETQCGTIDHAPPESDATCVICNTRYTDDEPRHCRLKMRCCRRAVCVGCITHHCAINSDFGCRSFATCIYCRAELPLFKHLDKPASPKR
jgi:hypothetical protein